MVTNGGEYTWMLFAVGGSSMPPLCPEHLRPPSVGAVTDGAAHYPKRLEELAIQELRQGERILAVLPFTTVPKRPRGPEGKVREGLWQSWKKYRPLVVTDQRVLVFDTGRTPFPRYVMAQFPVEQISMSEVTAGRFGVERFTLVLPGEGAVPFEAGKRDDLAAMRAALPTA